MRVLAIVACVCIAACGSSGAGTSPGDAAPDGAVGGDAVGTDGSETDATEGGVDATMDDASGDDASGPAADAEEEPIYLEAGVDDVTTPVCTGPLPDAGFSSLAGLPIANLCAQSNGSVWEGQPACQGSILVSAATGADYGQWWLFSAATGALEATGGGENGDYACWGGVAGFQFPYQCFYNRGWPLQTDLCADAGIVDAGFADGPVETGE